MTTPTKKDLQKEYDNLIASIRGYIEDSKSFGFKPIELESMQKRSSEISKQLAEF